MSFLPPSDAPEPPPVSDEIIVELLQMLQPTGETGELDFQGDLQAVHARAKEIEDLERLRTVLQGMASLACYLSTKQHSRGAAHRTLALAKSLAPKLAPLLGADPEATKTMRATGPSALDPRSGAGIKPTGRKGVGFGRR